MTLLLGPPGSGKSTLLLDLAGRLENSLRVMLSSDLHGIFKIVIELNRSSLSNRCRGKISYNWRELKEFVPQRTSAYVSQEDLHQGEMTVRETLDFSRMCLGVGSGEQTLREISRKEKEARIVPDREIEAFMRGTMTREERQTLLTANFVLPCADMVATWLPRRCQLCAIKVSGVKRGQNPNIGVEAAVSKHWGEKRTKPKHWGFPDYYPNLDCYPAFIASWGPCVLSTSGQPKYETQGGGSRHPASLQKLEPGLPHNRLNDLIQMWALMEPRAHLENTPRLAKPTCSQRKCGREREREHRGG